MTKVKDALNQEYTFTYDALGRVLTQSPRVGSTPMSYTYDDVGNRLTRTDYNGALTSYSYDNLNRLTGIIYDDSDEFAAYEYDDLSRVTSAENQNGTVAFTYDNRNRLKTETDVFEHLIEYEYDDAGNRKKLKLDNVVHSTYTYDVANRLTNLKDENDQNFTFGYDDANRLISKSMPNEVSSTFDYDHMSRLKRLKHTKKHDDALRRSILIQRRKPDQPDRRTRANSQFHLRQR